MKVFLSKAILDACVLFRAALRDTLLRAAEKGMYEVYWSDAILQEVNRNLIPNSKSHATNITARTRHCRVPTVATLFEIGIIKTGKMNTQQVQRLLSAMCKFFPDATVKGFESLIPEMKNDPKDRHVLAAAVMAEVDIIVTRNLQDFPNTALAVYEIEVLSPDEFLIYLFNQYPQIMTKIIIEQASELREPPISLTEVLNALAVDVPMFVGLVRDMLNNLHGSKR